MEIKIIGNEGSPLKKVEGFDGYRTLFIKDESSPFLNETHTFKDRQPQALAALLPKRYPNRHIVIAAMSTGNTAYSISHFVHTYNRQAGRELAKAVIFVPDTLEQRRYFGPDTSGHVVKTKDYMDTLEAMASVIRLNFQEKNAYGKPKYLESLTLAKECLKRGLIEDLFIDVTEGLETSAVLTREEIEAFSDTDYVQKQKLGIRAYEPVIREAIEALKKEYHLLPDIIVTQFGAGILFNEIVQYCKDHNIKAEIVPVAVGAPTSAADKIYASFWVDRVEGLQFMGTAHSKHIRYPKVIHGIEDWELGRALALCADKLDAEISGVAGLAILHRLDQIVEGNPRKQTVLVINTGNGIPNFMGKKRPSFSSIAKEKMHDDLISLRDASNMLRVHPNTLRHWETKGIIHSVRLGSRKDRKFRIEEIERLLTGSGSTATQEFAFHKGSDQFAKLFQEIAKRLTANDYYWTYAFDAEYADIKVRNILSNLHNTLNRNKVQDRVICRKPVYETIRKTFKENSNIDIRAVLMEIPTGVIILQDRVIHLLWGEEPAAYEVLNAEAVRQYQNLFMKTWEQATKPPMYA
jgi:predicted site-specific integrase-resolvase